MLHFVYDPLDEFDSDCDNFDPDYGTEHTEFLDYDYED